MSDKARWRKVGHEAWRMDKSGMREPPEIAVYNRGLKDYPPVWGIHVNRSAFNGPKALRHMAWVLNQMADKLERLAARNPEVAIIEDWRRSYHD